MKKGSVIICLLVSVFCISTLSAHAALELRGEGTSAYGTFRLIYDTDFNITWYDYSNSGDSWQNQMNWADALDVNFGGTHYTDWRLPTALNQDGSGPCRGLNCTNSEMGHLFYTELGNVALGGGFSNTGDFQHLINYPYYWSGTEYVADPNAAFFFDGWTGSQELNLKLLGSSAIAVRSGDVAVVPEPISSILFITGGAVLAGRQYLRRKRDT